jgi:two-component system, chemotaxis family, CheB/CheR fusion protein
LADQLILQQFSPSGVLVNNDGDILYISGRTGKYLEPASGKANMNIFSMLREGLRHDFYLAFRKVIESKKDVTLHKLKVGTNGSTQTLDISIQYIDKPGSLRGTYMIIFTDVPDAAESISAKKTRSKKVDNSLLTELEKKIHYLQEEMHTSQEEMQTSQEELKSTNEEWQSANEELQSANEELTSSKEEMQSLNEELQTVNAELLAKIEDFVRVDNDMKNLLNSTDIATLFLDKELNIRRYTNQATKIFKLIKTDIGRPFTDQVTDIMYPEMAADAREVLRTLVFIEKQIPGKDGKWYSIRLMPYRTFDDRIDGLVITFIDITDLKQMEQKYKEAVEMHDFLVNNSKGVFLKLSAECQVVEFNPGAEKFFGVKRENALGKDFFRLFVSETAQVKSRQALNKMISHAQDGKIKTEVLTVNNNVVRIECMVKILKCNKKGVAVIILTDEANK